jgi:membrane protein
VAAPSPLNDRARREPVAKAVSPKPANRMSGDLIVMAVLVGLSRAFFDPCRGEPVQRALTNVGGNITERGRSADEPTEIPAKGWKDIVWRVYEGLQNDRLLLVSAGVTFYALLALFPAIAAIVSLYGLFTDATTITEHLRLISGFLPDGALEVIGDQVNRITAKGQGTLGLTFMGTLVLSLWGANAGTKAVFDSLNIIYKEREKRSYLRVTLWSLAFTLGAIALVLVALASVVVVPLALELLGISTRSAAGFLTLLRWPLLYLVILSALACLYRYGPSRSRPQWRWVTWGSAIAGGFWIMGSLLLSWYVGNFGTYNVTYGSLGAIIGFMVWMWLSTIIVLGGAEINIEMEHQTAGDTTEGYGKPMGARGATMADEVGAARA